MAPRSLYNLTVRAGWIVLGILFVHASVPAEQGGFPSPQESGAAHQGSRTAQQAGGTALATAWR